jgi:hypothetical protein
VHSDISGGVRVATKLIWSLAARIEQPCTNFGIFLRPELQTSNTLTGMQRREEVSKVASGSSSGVNPEHWVDDHGDCLYKYAAAKQSRAFLLEYKTHRCITSVV